MNDDGVVKLITESIALERSGQGGLAMERLQQAFELARAGGENDQAANALVHLGDLHYRLGHFDEVKTLGEQALACAGKESHARVGALILMGNRTMEVGTLDECEAYYQAAAGLARQIGDTELLISALHDLGAGVYALRGQFDLAFAAEQESFRIACLVNSPLKHFMPISMCFDSLLTAQYERAKDLLDQILPLVVGNYRFEGYHTWLSAYLAQLQGDLPKAFELYAQTRQVAETTGDIGLNVALRTGLSACYQMAGDASAAYDWADDAVAWSNRVGTRRFLGRAFIERGRSTWLKGDLAGAEGDLRLAIADLASRRQAYDLARAHLLLAALLHQKQASEAQSAYREAVAMILDRGFTYLLERERQLALPLVAHYLNHGAPDLQASAAVLVARLASAPPPPLRILTLGRFEVYRRGIAIPAEAWRRQSGELFRLLLVSERRALAREQVIEALWPEKPVSTAAVFFHQATSCLRRALEPDLPDKFPSRYLLVEEGQVSLRLPSGSQVDFEVFELHVQKGEWQAALELYQGEPFPKDLYQDWASFKREQLVQQSFRARLASASQSLETGDPERALLDCQRVLAEEPWNEQAALLGMQACLRLNDRPAALRLYRNLEHCLHKEFGILPMPELKELYQSLVK